MAVSASLRAWRRATAPIRKSAQYAALCEYTKAQRAGILKRPDACQSCGREGSVVGHHEDYARPLYVWWLCSSCHDNRHVHLQSLGLSPYDRIPGMVPTPAVGRAFGGELCKGTVWGDREHSAPSSFAGRFRAARMWGGHPGWSLARDAGVANGTVSRYERGVAKAPRRQTVERLARVLGVSCDWLLTGEGEGPAVAA